MSKSAAKQVLALSAGVGGAAFKGLAATIAPTGMRSLDDRKQLARSVLSFAGTPA